MVSESDFIAAFQAYHDALEDPAAKIDTIRPLVNEHLEQIIVRLPGQIVQNAARKRAMDELDRIESMTKERAVEVAAEVEKVEQGVREKLSEPEPEPEPESEPEPEPEPEPDEPADALMDAFKVFDRDGNGVIDIDELRHMMVALGEDLSEDEIQATLAEADSDGDGVINFEEFKVIMLMDRSPSEPPVEEETPEEPEDPEPELEPVAELEPVSSPGGSISEVVDHLDSLKLFGEKRRYVESLSEQVFDFNLRIEKMEKTIGIGLTDEFRGGNTCIGAIDDIGVGVRMPNTMELAVGEELYVEAKLLEYRSVVKRFEFEQL